MKSDRSDEVLHHFGLGCTIGFQAAVSDTSGGKHPETSHTARKPKAIDIEKTFFYVFLFWSHFLLFKRSLIFQTFFFDLKRKTWAKFRAASRLTRSTFKITATK